jgi:hypothetical protein
MVFCKECRRAKSAQNSLKVFLRSQLKEQAHRKARLNWSAGFFVIDSVIESVKDSPIDNNLFNFHLSKPISSGFWSPYLLGFLWFFQNEKFYHCHI